MIVTNHRLRLRVRLLQQHNNTHGFGMRYSTVRYGCNAQVSTYFSPSLLFSSLFSSLLYLPLPPSPICPLLSPSYSISSLCLSPLSLSSDCVFHRSNCEIFSFWPNTHLSPSPPHSLLSLHLLPVGKQTERHSFFCVAQRGEELQSLHTKN